MTVRRAVSVAGAYCRPAASGQESGGRPGHALLRVPDDDDAAEQRERGGGLAARVDVHELVATPRQGAALAKSSAQANAGAMA